MHAMLTADGQAVPVTYNPATGQYVMEDGQPVVIQMHQEEQVRRIMDLPAFIPTHNAY